MDKTVLPSLPQEKPNEAIHEIQLTVDEAVLLDMYRELTDEGKRKAQELIIELRDKYKKPTM